MWTPVLANLGSIIVDVREAELPDLPYIFVGAQNCSHVGFVVDTLGTAEQPAALLGGIAAGSTLRILGSKLHLRIDTRTKWREMCMAGVHELDIRHASAQLSRLVLSIHQLWQRSGTARGYWIGPRS